MTEEELLESLNEKQQLVEILSEAGWKCEQDGFLYSAMRHHRQALSTITECLYITQELFDKVATSEFLELATQRIDDIRRINNKLRTEYDKEIKNDV